MASGKIPCNQVVLKATTAEDLVNARQLFSQPGVYQFWGGHPKSDEEIIAKLLNIATPDVTCLFVEVAGDVVGFAQYYTLEDGVEGGGMDLVLLPEVRGRGLGNAVVQMLVRFVRDELGWRRFQVDPDMSNARGVNFWKKVGFAPVTLTEDDETRGPYWIMEWPFSESG